ncbi:3-oxoadipate enol-lactonase [Massilia sp. UBA6681]|uniref:3-oxoadipate enol-lactonase n=1 Tax=Massilia sp. UBA6681 TaxID=1946839 RepID=UPI0025C31D9C|nr:3-oxoadipate enol-lactonase [Massilia sp. UBA6681]
MAFAQLDDIPLYYQLDGSRAKPCLLLSNSLGTDLGMWDRQAAVLAAHFFVVRYDTRGHGRSGSAGPVTIERLGRDVLGLMDQLDIRRAHFCGISMGGLTGQWLGVHAQDRIGKLVVANTAARIGTQEGWLARAAQVRADGMKGVAGSAAGRWFTPGFIDREPAAVDRLVQGLRATAAEGYAACCEALAQADLRGEVAAIASPLLVIAGRYDPVTTVEDARWLAAQVPDAQGEELAASHLSNIECPEDFSACLRRFLIH